jgi:two-component system, OmpR family, response regulator
MTARILWADDDPIMRDFVAQALEQQGYVVVEAGSVEETLERVRGQRFDLCILDRKMPGGDGLVALRALRADGIATPVLVLSSYTAVEQRVEGFDAGADDFLAKPFSGAELIARVRAILRRRPELAEDTLRSGRLELRMAERRVLWDGREVQVTVNEWRLLALLMRRPGVVHSRRDIMAEAGVAHDAEEAAVDHMVSRLRQKLRAAGADDTIRTARGQGFAWYDRTSLV